MRILLTLFLLLGSSVYAQVKILMPVVVKDAAGKAVTDLKQSDFTVSGPKHVRVIDMSLIAPATVARDDARPSIIMLYDAANIVGLGHERNVQEIRDFLSQVANHRLPVTLLVNTEAGLRLIYDSRTPGEVLTAALAATAKSREKPADDRMPNDAQVQQQVNNLELLESAVGMHRGGLDASVDQMKSLIAFAHLVERFTDRKALVWITAESPVDATEDPAFLASNANPWSKPLLPMYEAAIEELNAAHVSVYPLLFNGANPVNFGAVWSSWTALQQLAASTGGLAFKPGDQISFKQNTFLAAAELTMGDFGSYYTLTVEAPVSSKLDWIAVKIKVNHPGLTVRAAPGFLGLKSVKTK